ncbi:MAG: flagellar hook-basal body complex protein [Betaproteobacteria bacterium]|nr:flagellar hook-basal body complex protein [Betaproteobacteria bacterium]
MDRLAFNAVAAINEQRVSRQVTANEMANVSTPGFKRSYEVAMRAIKAEGAGLATRMQPESVSKDIISLKPGPVIATGRELDVAMNQQAVLGVSTRDGKLAFTRRGDLQVTATGVLQTGAGFAVRGEGGQPITVPATGKITINPDGSIYAGNPAVPNEAGVLVGRLLLRDASQAQLERREDGLFKVSGQADGSDITNGSVPGRVTPKAIEGSNVNAMEIMIKLMDQARNFEQQVRIIKESKTNDEGATSMLKLGG